MTTKDLSERQMLFISVLKQVNGNISKACSIAGQSRQTYYDWLDHENTAFAETIAEIQFEAVERRIDLAEEKLDQRLDLGSGPDVRFVLKTLGAKRGYGSKSEVTVNPGAGFKDMEWPDETPDIDQWKETRDKEMGTDADASQLQEGPGAREEDKERARETERQGAGPDGAGRL